MKEILDLLEIAALKARDMWALAETQDEAQRFRQCRLAILGVITLAKGDV
jgi:hypothetical protein